MTLPWLQAVEREFGERLHGDRLAHALMLSGPAHCGKVDLARRFMAAALCLENRYPACGRCRSCQLLSTGAHPDGHVVTFEERDRKPGVLRTELVVGQMRRLIDRLFLGLFTDQQAVVDQELDGRLALFPRNIGPFEGGKFASVADGKRAQNRVVCLVALGDLGKVPVDVAVVPEYLLLDQLLQWPGEVDTPAHTAEYRKVFNGLFKIGSIVLKTERAELFEKSRVF